MEIITVCGMGMGTSLILKMTIDTVLKKEGIEDVKIQHSDLGAAKSLTPDLFAISVDMVNMFEDGDKKYVAVNSVFDEAEVTEKVLPVIKEMLANK